MESVCPGCGVQLPSKSSVPDAQWNASGECLELRNELWFYTLRREDPFFIHQVAVDAYAAQHCKVGVPNIGLAFALIGLCLLLEHGYTGKQVQEAHKRLAEASKDWPTFVIPEHRGLMTVADALHASLGADRDSAIIAWAASVWSAYAKEQEYVRRTLREAGEIQ